MFQLCLSFLRSLRARRKQAHPDYTQPRAAVVLVHRERLELSILSALASKTSVYAIPPPTHYLHFLIYTT